MNRRVDEDGRHTNSNTDTQRNIYKTPQLNTLGTDWLRKTDQKYNKNKVKKTKPWGKSSNIKITEPNAKHDKNDIYEERLCVYNLKLKRAAVLILQDQCKNNNAYTFFKV